MEVMMDEMFIEENVDNIRETLGYFDPPPPPPPETREPVLVSMVDGKIGSVYFKEGRIRLTHDDGPAEEMEGPEVGILRVNLIERAAIDEFMKSKVKKPEREKFCSEEEFQEAWYDTYIDWLIERLTNRSLKKLPKWAILVESAEGAQTDRQVRNRANQVGSISLFEVFGKLKKKGIFLKYMVLEDNGEYHDSRGAAVQFQLLPSEVSLLKNAVRIAEDDARYHLRELLQFRYKVGSIDELTEGQQEDLEVELVRYKNKGFYQIVESNLPEFAKKYLRTPEEVNP